MVRPRDRSAPYARHDFPDFAQEFLRRNPDYRAQQAQDLRGSDTEQLARTWGLHFPVRPCCRSICGARMLARRSLTLCPDDDGFARRAAHSWGSFGI